MENKAKEIRNRVLKMLYESQKCHLGSCMSVVEIMVVLYNSVMKPEDIFILSKGHAVATWYAIFADRGIITEEELKTFGQSGGLPGHATKRTGIVASTGSLGHGLPIAVGMALANKKRRVFCLMGDGECQAGTTWESAMFAAQHKLENLTVIVDNNGLQGYGRTNDIVDFSNLHEKWAAFGWQSTSVNGHKCKDLAYIFNQLPLREDKPTCVIAETIKGKGVKVYEDKLESHYYNIDEEQYQKAIR